MSRYAKSPRVAMQVSRGVVVASIQIDLDDDVLSRFQEDLLGRVHETTSRAVILDVSGLDTLDSHEFAALRRIIAAVTIMGSESVLVGLQPGVVSGLIEVGADVEGLQTAIDLDAAFELLEPEPLIELRAEPELEPGDDAGDDAGTATADPGGDFPTLVTESMFEDDR